MNHEDDLTLPQPDPAPGASPQPSTTPIASPSWFARYRIAVVSAAGAVVVGAVAVAAVLLLSQPNPTVEKLVPATHDVLVIANLNPSFAQKSTWRDETYNGISIASGTPIATTSEKPVAYSYVDHVVVVASSVAVIHEIIDTDQGRGARLVDSSDYKATMALLPSDRVGIGYLAGKSLVAGVKQQMTKPSTLGLPALKTVDDLNALQGIGGALSATGTGIAFDLAVKLDKNKLSPATRQAFSATGRPDAALRWLPN